MHRDILYNYVLHNKYFLNFKINKNPEKLPFLGMNINTVFVV